MSWTFVNNERRETDKEDIYVRSEGSKRVGNETQVPNRGYIYQKWREQGGRENQERYANRE